MRSWTQYHTLNQDVPLMECGIDEAQSTVSHPKEGGCQEVTSVILVCLCDDSGTSTNSMDWSTYHEDWCINTGQMEQLGTEL